MKNKDDKSLFEGFNSLSELGEFGFISRIAGLFAKKNLPGVTGIGDDCAVLPYSDRELLLVTTDMLIENRHFIRDRISPKDLAYKSLAVNLSDISAMGGRPAYAFLSLGIPEDLDLQWLDQFLIQTQKLSGTYNVSLSGGDTTKSPDGLIINYTLLGFAKTGDILYRSGAKPGDLVGLLGNIGESGAGLKLLLRDDLSDDDRNRYRQLIRAHTRPRLFIHEAQFLSGFKGIHSMIDLSDGIASDAGHIADQSGISLRIDIDKLPLSPLLEKVCSRFSWQAVDLALTAGEDYGLLFTVGKTNLEMILTRFEKTFGYRFTVIGEVMEGAPDVQYVSEGKLFKVKGMGFDHFK